tara:strand:+ start:163 stop:390 length:228 start_codon:yes stop_codon:yes gene_type:complete
MTINDLYFAVVINLFISILGKMDWTNGYNCPQYCDILHEHIGLDWQSSSDLEIDKKAKSNKIKDLGLEKNYCNLK